MDYKQILQWVVTALSVLSIENVLAIFASLEKMVAEIQKLWEKLGIPSPIVQNLEADTDEERALENCIAVKLQESSSAPLVQGQFDFSRIRNVLKLAKELGLLDILMAALVGKIPLQLNADETADPNCKVNEPTAVASDAPKQDLNQKKD